MTPRLFLHAFSTEARKWMSYRADFWLTAVFAFVAHFGVAYCLWRAIFDGAQHAEVAGYSFDHMLLYYVLAILFGKLVRGSDRMADVAQDIYEGSLSRYLVYPTSYFGFKYAQHLGQLVPAGVQLGVLAILYTFILPFPQEVTIGAVNIAMACGSILVANLLFYSMSVPLQAVAFWADNVWSLVVMMRFVTGLLGGAMLPLALFPEWAQEWLLWLPFRYLYDFPIAVLTGQVTLGRWLLGIALGLTWIALIGAVTRIVWRRGMLAYSGVGI
ncbi:MAG: ABC-2 type transport system permease protein [Planctomycetota bacterium]|jgi:ABC-2 type transport system permease protein